eukprot:3861392-Amphidinium_carterae.1
MSDAGAQPGMNNIMRISGHNCLGWWQHVLRPSGRGWKPRNLLPKPLTTQCDVPTEKATH